MGEPKPITSSPLQAPRPAGARGPAAAAPGQGAVAFRALIERLEEHARALAAEAANVERPADLAGAVDKAHASLEDALALKEGLLEAWRAARLRGEAR